VSGSPDAGEAGVTRPIETDGCSAIMSAGGDMLNLESADLVEVTYPDGAPILVEGQRHHELLILVSGAVRITALGAEIRIIDEPGSYFGEMATLLDAPATATATAIGECRFLKSDDPESFMRDHPGVALEIASTLARRLDVITRYLADLRNQYADRSDHLGVVDAVLESLMQHQGAGVEPGSEREPDAPY
jgi:CRP/FNR family transcriptional regulator, cyclic AMP receptor protein